MSDQREDFEEAAARMGYNLTMAEHETGEYQYPVTQDAWNMWQECCDKAARAQGDAEPVAFGIFYEGVFQEHAWNEEAANAIAAEDYHGLSGITVQPVYTRPPAAKVPDWTNRLNTCKHHDDDHEACAVYGGRVPCDAEGGEAVADWANRSTATQAGWVNELLTLAGHPDKIPAFARSAMRTIARGLKATTPQPNKWIPCGEKMQAELVEMFEHGDSADHYNVLRDLINEAGLTRPTPPEQEPE